MKNKQQFDPTALGKKVAHKSSGAKFNIEDKLKNADRALGIDFSTEEIDISIAVPVREAVIRRSYALLNSDLEAMNTIANKCLNQKIRITNDSHIVRLAIMLASELSEAELANAFHKLPEVKQGRPPKNYKK